MGNSKHTYIARSMVWLLAATALCVAEEEDVMSNNKLVWTSPSQDSRGSMPIGNGEVGANVWVEEKGDLQFYLSRTDAWSENCRLLKLGKVRMTLTPNPLQTGGTFNQTLDLDCGEILIRFKANEQDVAIRFAVDAHHPVVTVDVCSRQPVEVQVSLENWRTRRRELKGAEAHSAYGLLPAGGETLAVDPIFVESDRIMTGQKDRVIWYHRNERSVWKANLELQALGEVAEKQADPLLYRTFGALITGEGLVSQSDITLRSATPANSIHLAVYTLTDQTQTADAWIEQLQADAQRIGALSCDERRAAHRAWWKAFWERSHIRISTKDDKDRERVETINRGYRLQRFVNACAGRGRFPIKFNGSIFTVDTMNHTDRFSGFDADYRQWGGPYWWQNTRLPYWSMLESGDFDLMIPLFRMFRQNLESRKIATKNYYNHDGAFFPETQYFWGSYADSNYGRERSDLPDGMTRNRFIRYYWQGGLELSLMMLDHYAFTGDEAFARQTLIPLASALVTFFDQHWQRDAKGKIRFDPAMALETYREAVNPLAEIVGIQKVCEAMLALPETLTTAAQRTQWQRLISELPPVPMREENGETLLACADSYSGKQNVENPELYAIFPYRRYGLGKPDLELARRTFAKRLVKQTGGWQQNAIKAAYLGLSDEAARMVGQNFGTWSNQHRFPAMWGPNYDWIPDQDHGSVAMIALQRMLLQYEGNTILLLPAWPRHWDVDFKLHAPRSTTVEGRVRNGELMNMIVSPVSRRGDVVTDWNIRNCTADLPDTMTFLDGREVKTLDDWAARKAEIKALWCDTFLGRFPEEIPALLSTEVVRTEKPEDGSIRQRVLLTFDTPNRKSFEIEVWIPKMADGTSRPLLLTQARHYQRQKWGEEALRRGYVVCIYPGLDVHHSEPDYPDYQNVWRVFQSEYPDATWDSSLGIQAWLASRTLDYLLDTQYGYEIDASAVGITGFSRYGKQSIYAAAFDERFTCVVARSSGTPTSCPYRFAARQTFMESVSLEDCPEVWLMDKARTFHGRENELPIEGNALMACIAPRHLMLDTAHNDGCDPTFGVERSYLNAKKVWTFLGKEENICLSYRKGNHGPVTEEQVAHNLDFFDMAFGRGDAKATDFSETLIHAFDWPDWKAKQRESDLVPPEKGSVRRKIEWMLGERPAKIEDEGVYHIKTEGELGVSDASRDRWNPGGIKRIPFSFGAKMHGNLFVDPELERPKATVIWLHPWNYSHGSNEGYGVQGTTIYYRLAQEGYKVVMYDQFGFGDHLSDAVDFYDRHPHWSRMGRAVYDVQKVLDFLVDGKGITEDAVPASDPAKIYVCGFAYGGMVGLYAAALDERIAGLACFSGFTPMRTDTDAKPTGGIRQYWEWHALLPKLGLYHGREADFPYDYDDLLGLIAPRNCLIYAPRRDRFADSEDVRACVMKSQAAWQDAAGLTFMNPDDICRLQRHQQDVLIRWMKDKVNL